MKACYTAAAVTAALLFFPASAQATCRIFQHRDYGGSGYTLHNFERMKMVRGESLGCTTNEQYVTERVNTTSLYLYPDCSLQDSRSRWRR